MKTYFYRELCSTSANPNCHPKFLNVLLHKNPVEERSKYYTTNLIYPTHHLTDMLFPTCRTLTSHRDSFEQPIHCLHRHYYVDYLIRQFLDLCFYTHHNSIA